MNKLNALFLQKIINNNRLGWLGIAQMSFEDPLFLLERILIESHKNQMIDSKRVIFKDFSLPTDLTVTSLFRTKGKPQALVNSETPHFQLIGYTYEGSNLEWPFHNDIYFFIDNRFIMKTVLFNYSLKEAVTQKINTLRTDLLSMYTSQTLQDHSSIHIKNNIHQGVHMFKNSFSFTINLFNHDPDLVDLILGKGLYYKYKPTKLKEAAC
jgi:hypothetical protein